MIEQVQQRAGRKEWVGLAVISIACVLYIMDLSVLEMAIPAISEDLHPSSVQLLWIIDVYGFMVAGFLITMGSLGDRLGRRKLLLYGAGFFGAASVFAAFAQSAEMLIFARAVMGVAGATIAPSTLSLIRNMFADHEQRSRAIGVWVTSFSVGGAVGPVIGGIVLEFYWWGAVFLINVPVMALLLVLGPKLLPEFKDPTAGRADIPSLLASLSAILLVVFAIKKVAQDGLSVVALAALTVGVVVGVWFVRRQRGLDDPLIDLHLFGIPAFRAALVIYGIGVMVMFGGFLFMPQYLQLVLGYSPFATGMWMVPSAAMFVLGSNVSPWLLRWCGPAIQLGTGLVLAAIGFGIIALVQPDQGLWQVVVGSILFSLGLAPIFTLTTDVIISAAPANRAGAAAGISETSAELGGALGIAVFGSIAVALYRARIEPALSGVSADAAESARGTLGGAMNAARALPGEVGHRLLSASAEAFTVGMQVTAVMSALLALGLGGLVLARGKSVVDVGGEVRE
ncbi:MFS transporter [Smaragdicoccus niigatensis]|uniref:MFS transporter n=1 Tax=Smaragdicoccus niigatensis TaxID=359359 RepID=UPI00039E8EF7|nr:MFS transporter [Smaragdicoccus niigatensis]